MQDDYKNSLMNGKKSHKVLQYCNGSKGIIGKLVAACPAVTYGWAHIKYLERAKYILLRKYSKYSTSVTLPQYITKDIEWWIKNIHKSTKKIEISKEFTETIYTDASKTGWGAHYKNNSIHGFWSVRESQEHINYLEIRAALYALKWFGKNFTNKNILLKIDNKTGIACINKKGSAQFKKLNDVTRDIWDWCVFGTIYVV
nr:unnamed protein product [Callosobruchus analis]